MTELLGTLSVRRCSPQPSVLYDHGALLGIPSSHPSSPIQKCNFLAYHFPPIRQSDGTMCCRSNGDQQEQGREDGCEQQSEDRVKDGVECAELGMAATCRCWVGLLGHDPALPWTARAETVQLWESCFAAAHRPSLRGPTCLCPGRRRMQATKCWCPSCRLPGCDGYDVAVATTELTKAPGVKGASGRGVLISPSQWRQRLFWLLLRRTTADILHGAKMEFNRAECAVPSAEATRHCSGSKTQMLLLTSRVAGRPGSLLWPECYGQASM